MTIDTGSHGCPSFVPGPRGLARDYPEQLDHHERLYARRAYRSPL